MPTPPRNPRGSNSRAPGSSSPSAPRTPSVEPSDPYYTPPPPITKKDSPSRIAEQEARRNAKK